MTIRRLHPWQKNIFLGSYLGQAYKKSSSINVLVAIFDCMMDTFRLVLISYDSNM
jgi:hypothetical protein